MAFISNLPKRKPSGVVSRIQARKFGDKKEYGDNWEELSKAVRSSHNYMCSHCLRSFIFNKKMLQTDHIMQISKGGVNALVNLRPLCVDCHRKKTLL